MVRYKSFCLLGFIFSVMNFINAEESHIHLNSIGYLPDMPKKAVISKACSSFELVNSLDDEIVFKGKTYGPMHQDDVNQDVWIADFSKFSLLGNYYLNIPGVGQSIPFEIGNNIYDSVYYTVMRAFYLWRCGTSVEGMHKGSFFSQKACHLLDGYMDYIGSKDTVKDGTGGWHDAGDYGKYTINAGLTIANLLWAWEHFKNNIEGIALNLPETAPGYPEFLKEIKWETDWLLKMQYPDSSGKISHKLTRLNFEGFIMPDVDFEKRYYSEWTSGATANFSATMAMASRYFKEYDLAYAKICLDAARRSYEFLKNHPQEKPFEKGDFNTGWYKSPDAGERLWASAELWETTGESKYLWDFEEKVSILENKVDENWDWGNLKNLAMFTYLLSKRENKSPEILEKMKSDLLSVADTIVLKSKTDIYERPLGGLYYWGCNGTVVRLALTLRVADLISPNPEYIKTMLNCVNYMFGQNYYGRSFVTGIGHLPPMNPHDRRAGGDNISDPWPGYLVGGGTTATDWLDEESSFRTNEIAINWQASLVYALAGFVK